LVATLSRIYRHKIILTDIFIAFKKDTGGRALPIKIQAMKIIASRQNLPNVKLDNQLYENPLIQQRALEYLYPLRIDQNSTYLFTDQRNFKNKRCKLIDKETDIELFQC
jgi:hypothetical protein